MRERDREILSGQQNCNTTNTGMTKGVGKGPGDIVCSIVYENETEKRERMERTREGEVKTFEVASE